LIADSSKVALARASITWLVTASFNGSRSTSLVGHGVPGELALLAALTPKPARPPKPHASAVSAAPVVMTAAFRIAGLLALLFPVS
jgi:hypothetical protein